jgi:hypothetical protein
VTSALLLSYFERKRAKRLSNKLIDVVNSSKPIKQDDKCHNVAGINKRSKRCDVTYTISVVGLASQEVDVLANLTNEKL